jgi:hypothetical protein
MSNLDIKYSVIFSKIFSQSFSYKEMLLPFSSNEIKSEFNVLLDKYGYFILKISYVIDLGNNVSSMNFLK